jgi:predicted DNA binding protein
MQAQDLVYFTVDFRHDNCWALEATSEIDAGLLGFDTTLANGARADHLRLYRVYGESLEAVEALIDVGDESSLTSDVIRLGPSVSAATAWNGSVSRDILVEFEQAPSLRQALTDHGFTHYGPSKHEDGHERRWLLTLSTREEAEATLAAVAETHDTDMSIVRVSATTPTDDIGRFFDSRITPRQREVYELATARGYYEYPRETTARELGAELGISKTTVLEHLRKAEHTLLDSFVI